MPLYSLTKQQKDALKTRNAIQKANDLKLPEVLTQAEAHKRFPDRRYDTYDPCIVVCGTKKSINDNCRVLSQMKIKTIQGDISFPLDPTAKWDGPTTDMITHGSEVGYQVDVLSRNDTRIVIWK